MACFRFWAPTSSKRDAKVEKEDASPSPARYLLKCESVLAHIGKNSINKYESRVFQSNGYKWKLIIYPEGDGSEDGRDHISMYLAIAETSSLRAGWEVNATFSFLVFDQVRDKYIVLTGMEGRFRNIKTDWGFSKCISHATVKEPSNGYLVNDKCFFGVDVYVIKKQPVVECISSSFNQHYKHEWKVSEFSKLANIYRVYSEEFTVGDYNWRLLLYPAGGGRSKKGKSISIYLDNPQIHVKGLDYQRRILTKFSISVKDQITGLHHKYTGHHWFTAGVSNSGWLQFMSLSKLKDPKKGFLVNDSCIVEAEVSILRVVD